MSISVGQTQALAVKGIDAKGGVKDSVFKNNAYLARLEAKKGAWDGVKMSFPFNYYDSTQTTGGFYNGAAVLSKNIYDPLTELSFELIELYESLVITKRDLALNQTKSGRINLVQARLKMIEKALRERFTKGIFSDGTVSTGALSADQFVGMRAFLKDASVSYGNLTDTDVSSHIAYVNDNSSVARALTTALVQDVIGGASEGNEKPTVGIMKQATMNSFIELLKPHQRTTRESTLNGLGHEKNTLVYSGLDFIVDNLSIANSIAFLNEEHVKLYAHAEYDMKRESWDKLEDTDAIMERIFWKGTYACSSLRYQGLLKDLSA